MAQSHHSDRLKRPWRNDDWLTRIEAAKVLSENSGREINPDFLKVFTQRGKLHPREVSPRVLLYQYAELRDMAVQPRGGGRPHDNPTNNALRQRRWRERHAEELRVKSGGGEG